MSLQAIILLGGQGTRLRALYPNCPKALVPVCGRPFLEHQLRWLIKGGISDVHLAAGYRADAIADWLPRAPFGRMSITMSREPKPLGTGGALRFADYYVRTDPFVVVNGDTLLPAFDFHTLENFQTDFPDLGNSQEAFFQSLENWRAYLVTAPIEESGRYGTVEFDSEGRVTAFREKAQRAAGWVNGGVYLVPRRVLSRIPAGRIVSVEQDIFPELVREQRLFVIQAKPPLLDMGTPDGLQTMEHWLQQHPV